MVGQELFERIHRHAQEATGRSDLPFGGLHVLLFGDFGQLPPVGDSPLWLPPAVRGQKGSKGFALYRGLTGWCSCQQHRQQGRDEQSARFREALLRLRDGTSTPAEPPPQI